ncbi:hypothetical protein GS506_15960 [Rhodococcus hoagii]|nr:hypothetical protein [Prescottella equi]
MEIEAKFEELAVIYASGSITAAQLTAGSEALRESWDRLVNELAVQVPTGPFVDLVGVTDVQALWFGAGVRAGMPLEYAGRSLIS